MLTEVRRKKLSYLFDILDANKNGLLQPDDFAAVAEKICNILEFDGSSTERLQLKLKSLRLYVQLLTDMNKEDVSISKPEWLELFGSRTMINPKTAKKYIFRTAAYIFNLFDQNGDRIISKEEYLDMFRIYNIDLEYSEIGFQKIDENSDGQITLSEMIAAFRDFLMSSNPEAAGNWIFGNWDTSQAA
ncbi:MAG: EF-hand domain-containing protein [Marinoscillum sp.]